MSSEPIPYPLDRNTRLSPTGTGLDVDAFERKLFVIRKQVEHAVKAENFTDGKQFYVPSMSARTIVYKGMLLARQVGEYYLDLANQAMVSALALVHQRFSTNTLPERFRTCAKAAATSSGVDSFS